MALSFRNWLLREPLGRITFGSFLAVMIFAVWIYTGAFNPEVEYYLSSGGLILFYLAGAAYGLRLCLLKHLDNKVQLAWLFLFLAATASAIAEFLWVFFEKVLIIDPFPSLADIFYLLYYPLILIGVLLFPHGPMRKQERLIFGLDMAIVLTSSLILLWYFILAPLYAFASLTWTDIIAISYPLGDVLLLAGMITIIQRDIGKVARITLPCLAASMFFSGLSDVFFAYYETAGLDYNIAPLNIAWLLSALLYFMATAWQYHSSKMGEEPLVIATRSQQLLRVVLPYLAVSIGPVIWVASIGQNILSSPMISFVMLGTLLVVGLVLLRQYAVLAENYQLLKSTEKLAITDSLTSLYNRHFFNETLQIQLQRAKRYHTQFSVILMDVDNFKKMNDRFGHLGGDQVLRLIAKELLSQLRRADILSRFGGDEFSVILPETGLEGAQVVANKMKETILKANFQGHSISISAGVSTYQPGQSPEQVIEAADKELYQQKALKQPDN